MFYSGDPKDAEVFIADSITLAAGVVFGAIHCVAWSFHLPSPTESLLWRTASSFCCVIALLRRCVSLRRNCVVKVNCCVVEVSWCVVGGTDSR
jgi:hypothetical protein